MSAEDRTLSDPFAKVVAPAPDLIWTEEKDAYLRENHDGTTARMRLIGEALDIPWYQVKARALALGLTNPDETQPRGNYGLKRVKVEPPTAQCVACGTTFTPRKSDQRYCSASCRSKDATKAHKRKLAETVQTPEPPPYELTIVPTKQWQPVALTPQPPKAVTYMIFADLVELLPESRTWTSAERQRWLRMFVGVLDYVIALKGGDEA